MMDSRARQLLDELAVHTPSDQKEQRDVALLRRYLSWLKTPFDEFADPTHVTASAIVFDGADGVLVHRHKRLGLYLQPGGHVDGSEHPSAAAKRELREETGVVVSDGHLVHVDIHQGPRGHVHLDLRYGFNTSPQASFQPLPGESQEIFFMHIDRIARETDASLARAVVAARKVL